MPTLFDVVSRARIITHALFVLSVGTPAVVAAQSTGTISGRVVNASTREAIAGVVIRLPATASGTIIAALSDSVGAFVVRTVPVGVTRLEVRRLGFTPVVRSDIVVSTARRTEVVIELTPVATELVSVTVAPTYFPPLPPASFPVSTQRFGAEEVRRAPGVQEDVVRAVSVLPGVGVTTAGRNDLVVRGGAPFENLFTVDGIEVPNINHFGTQGSTGGPLSLINVAFVEDAALSAGGFGVRFGDRTASVTAIRLREGSRDRMSGSVNISATGGGAYVEGPLGERGSFLFGVRRSYLDFIFKAAGFSFIPSYRDLTGKAVWRLSSRDQLSAVLIGAQGTVTFNNDTDENRFENSRVVAPQQDQYFSGLIWQRTLSKGLLTTTLGRTFTRYTTTQNDSGGPGREPSVIFAANTTEGEQSLRTDLQWQLSPRVDVETGVVAKYGSDLRYDLTVPGAFRRDAAFVERPLRRDTSFTATRGALYTQATSRLGERLRLTLGVRGDWYGYLSNAVRTAPRASAVWQHSARTSASVSVGRYWQPPQLIWLVGDASNASLKPFSSDQVIAGVSRTLRDDVKLQVEVYGKRYRQYPARRFRPQAVLQPSGFDDATNDIPFGLEPLANLGRGTVIGAELLLQKKLSQVPVYGLLTVSANRTRFAAMDGVERPGAFDAPVVANVLLGWRPNAKWELSGRVRTATGLPTTPFVSAGVREGTLDFSRYNAGGRLPQFFTLDARIDRRWQIGKSQLITYLDVQNATARQNVSAVAWSTRLRAPERQTSIGVLPSIGIDWTF